MKVLHIIPSLDSRTGGPATAVAGLAIAQQHAGIDVEVFAEPPQSGDTSLSDAMTAQNVSVCLAPPLKLLAGKGSPAMSALKQSFSRADLLHIHGLWEPIQHAAAVMARGKNLPYIFTPHGMLDPWSLSQGKWKKRIYLAWRLRRNLNSATALHFTANLERDLVAPLRLRPPAIIERNGIDVTEFNPLPEKGLFRAKYPQIADRQIVLFLSRVHPKKGLNILIPAFAQGAPSEIMLVFAGPYSDAYRGELEKLIRHHNIQDRVVWTGMLRGRERIEAYVDADLFCLPSYQENFGIAIIESLAAGTPVIISNQVAIHEEISRAGVGGVVQPDIGELAQELRAWLNDPQRLAIAGAKAKIFAQEIYNWDKIGQDWRLHYQRYTINKQSPCLSKT